MSIGSTNVDFKEIYNAINDTTHPGTSGTPISMDDFYNMSFSDNTSTPSSGTIGIGGYPEDTNNMRGKTIKLDNVFTSHTFTNCGATGRLGPTLAQCKAEYPSWASDTNFFNMTSQGIQEWTVPSSGKYRIECYGAGGTTTSSSYSLGAIIKGDMELLKGDKYFILVGQKAPAAAGGNGGTFVATGTSYTTAGVKMVAGGGGGINISANLHTNTNASITMPGKNGNTGYGGGNSGGTESGYGGQTNTNNTSYGGGGGGGFYGDGVNTSSYSSPGIAFRNGGYGGDKSAGSNHANTDGGFGGGGAGYSSDEPAGGGGFSGGGGGGYNASSNIGGNSLRYSGGGGSYTNGANQSNSATHNGQGKVIITKLSFYMPLGADITSVGGNGWSGRPFNTYFHDNKYQAIYPAAELTAAGMVSGNSINSIKFKISQQPGRDIVNLKIGYAWVLETTFSSWLTPDYSTSISTYDVMVGTPPIPSTPVNGWTNKFTFNLPGTWDGSTHLLIEYQNDGTGYSDNGAVYHKKAANGTIASTWKYNDSTNPNMTSLTFDSSNSADDAPYIEIYF